MLLIKTLQRSTLKKKEVTLWYCVHCAFAEVHWNALKIIKLIFHTRLCNDTQRV